MATISKEQRQVQKQALRTHADAVKKLEDAKARALEARSQLTTALRDVKQADLARLDARAACETAGVRAPRGKSKGEAAEESEPVV
jgi:hypothetical protein